jgi:hypothetical protein
VTIPQEVDNKDDSEWVLAYERIASRSLPPSSLAHHDFLAVVNSYLRATMTLQLDTAGVYPQEGVGRGRGGEADV